MAKRLSIDLEALQETIDAFQTAIDELNQSVAAVDVAMGHLRATKWHSDASAAYFMQYSDNWRISVKNHLVALLKLSEGLVAANNEYSALSDQIPRLMD
jgi:WXG100 family type VII secretion target